MENSEPEGVAWSGGEKREAACPSQSDASVGRHPPPPSGFTLFPAPRCRVSCVVGVLHSAACPGNSISRSVPCTCRRDANVGSAGVCHSAACPGSIGSPHRSPDRRMWPPVTSAAAGVCHSSVFHWAAITRSRLSIPPLDSQKLGLVCPLSESPTLIVGHSSAA